MMKIEFQMAWLIMMDELHRGTFRSSFCQSTAADERSVEKYKNSWKFQASNILKSDKV